MTSRRAVLLLPALLIVLVLAPAAGAHAAPFVDIVDAPHEAAVTALAEEGVIQGCDDDNFCSRQDISRGQVASVLVAALGLDEVDDAGDASADEGVSTASDDSAEEDADGTDGVADTHATDDDAPASGTEDPAADGDVTADADDRGEGTAAPAAFGDISESVHRGSIEALAREELIAGCGDGDFCPADPVTREQLASMLRAAFEVPDAVEDVTYFDDIGGVHAPAVRSLAEHGITSGCTQRLTSFCASDSVQRAHAAMFVARAMDLVDRVELAPFEEREAEQDKIEEAAAAAAEPTPAEVAVDVALAQLGKPYRWGGSGPHSFDCSGLTSYAWAQAGVTLPRSSGAQYSGTTRISRSELRPGDLVFYHQPISHVAMYIGGGRVVESPNSGNNVRIREDGLTRSGVVGYGRVRQ